MKNSIKKVIKIFMLISIICFFSVRTDAENLEKENKELTKTYSNTSEKTKENGIYKVAIGKEPNIAFELPGGNKSDNTQVGMWNYGDVAWQKFYFEYKDGYYKITAMHTGKSLTAKNNNVEEGTEVVQTDYIDSNGQKWRLRDTNKNGWIISPLSNPDLAITVDGTIQNGTKIILSKTLDNDNQMLYLYNINDNEKVRNEGIYNVAIGKDSNKSFELPGGNKENNTQIGVWNYGNATWQKFYFKYEDGFYKITAMHTGKSLTVKNNNITKKISIKPVSDKNGNYMLGIWVRDDSQGIGTVTFITKDNKYCALGHGISDIDTGELLSSNNGTIFKANIWGIRKGESGKPGGLCGSIEYNNKNIIGDITKNCACGLYGNMDKKIISGYNISEKEIGLQSEIKKGEASIQFIADGKVNIYKIEIENIYANAKEKNMVIKITDKRLLNKTGGIVQGMSGSPIIQNGKVIGAVTHVMINDPTRGYGILAENMLKSI